MNEILYATAPTAVQVLVCVIVVGIVGGLVIGVGGLVALEIWSRIISIQIKREEQNRAEQ